MRISDWSSDVCSSDLSAPVQRLRAYSGQMPQGRKSTTRRTDQFAGLTPGHAIAGVAAAGTAGLAYATLIERNAFALRHQTLPVHEPGSTSLRVLHIRYLHMTPGHRPKRSEKPRVGEK